MNSFLFSMMFDQIAGIDLDPVSKWKERPEGKITYHDLDIHAKINFKDYILSHEIEEDNEGGLMDIIKLLYKLQCKMYKSLSTWLILSLVSI